MCGIVAVWNKEDIIFSDKLLKVIQLLNYRGPDCQKIWLANNKRVGLAQARLRIVDLEKGDQPLHSQDGSLHLVVNGEFYDHKSIRKTLQNEGYTFSTCSDSEILLVLYQKYGVECLSYLNGEFAFVIYDEAKNLLFAARDRFGVKPLYYAIYNGNLYLASEGKAILELGVPAKWNETALWMYASLVPSQFQSCFKGINHLKPGHFLLANMDNFYLVEQKYWDLNFPQENNFTSKISDQYYIEEFQNLFTQAVRRRLNVDVPVGCYLSGGIDSSSVASIASEQAHHLSAFNVAFAEDETLNELNFAKELVEMKNMDFYSLPVTMQDIVDNYSQALWHTEWPIMFGSPVAKYLLSKYVHSLGVKVVLTGDGSDELLAGYQWLWEDCIKNSADKEDQLCYSQFKALGQDNSKNQLPSSLSKPIIKQLGYLPAMMKAAPLNIFNKEFLNQYLGRSAELEFLKSISIPKGIAKANMSMYLSIKSRLPIIGLNLFGERMEMAHSIEGRTPFLDKNLVEFIQTLPPNLKARGFIGKFILKEAMKNKVPYSIYKRSKHAFKSPSIYPNKKGKISPIYHYMQEVFNSDYLQRVYFLNHKLIIKRFNQHVKDNDFRLKQETYMYHFILSLCLLSERFKLSA